MIMVSQQWGVKKSQTGTKLRHQDAIEQKFKYWTELHIYLTRAITEAASCLPQCSSVLPIFKRRNQSGNQTLIKQKLPTITT